jgi:hypothetical protein
MLTEVCRFKSPQGDSGFWPKAAEWCNAESRHLSEDKLSLWCVPLQPIAKISDRR